MLEYSLRPNRFTDDPDDQLANVEHSGTATFDDLITHITQEGGAIKESEARSNVLEFFKAMRFYLALGRTISLEFMNIRFTISGVFTDSSDSFDSNRHKLNLKVNAGSFLKEVLPNMKLSKVKATVTAITIDRVQDYMSKTNDTTLTAGGMVRLLGENLTIDTEDTEQGIYLIANDNTETKVEFLQLITGGELMFQTPAELAKGTYTLEVRAKIRFQKEISKGRFEDLTI